MRLQSCKNQNDMQNISNRLKWKKWLSMEILIVLLLALISFSSSAVEIFFSPSHDCENQIIAGFNNAQKEIVVSVYSINNPRIVPAMIAAKKRGVNMRVLTDRTQAAGKSSKVLELLNAGVDIRVHSKHKIEHNKFGVFDDKLAISGSYNWTEPASEVNSENCVIMPEKNAIEAYKKRFEQLWEWNTQKKSDASIAKMKNKQTSQK